MPRRAKSTYRCRPIAELVRQLLYSPERRRIEQVRRTEKLHDSINPRQTYPFDFLCYHITRYHTETDGDVLLVGEAIGADLRLAIDQLSRSVHMPVGDEPIETIDELAARLKVSTKTINRWRSRGLRWRWMQPDPSAGGPRRIVFTRSAVAQFTSQYAEQIAQAGAFTQIDDTVRDRLIARARRIVARRDASLNQVATHLARRTGRGHETIRTLLEKHDQDDPAGAIFTDQRGPLDAREKRLIRRAHRMGIPVDALAQRFGRSAPTIYRVLREKRAALIRRLDLRHVANAMFAREDADEVILRPEPTPPAHPPPSRPPAEDLPDPLRSWYTQPGLSAETERYLFTRMNYLKYKADRRRGAMDRYVPRVRDLDAIESMLREAGAIRQRLINANLHVVLAIARQHMVDQHDPQPRQLLAYLELGSDLLIESVDTFDAGRRQRFEAYLRWVMMRALAQRDPTEHRATRRENPVAVMRRIQRKAHESGTDWQLNPEANEGPA